jgi:hypothetical protein
MNATIKRVIIETFCEEGRRLHDAYLGEQAKPAVNLDAVIAAHDLLGAHYTTCPKCGRAEKWEVKS